MSFVGKGLFIIFFVVFLLPGCAAPEIASEITSGEQVIPEELEFVSSISISVPQIQISGGNLHWHKQLPNNTYTLEDIAIEIYNFSDSDIKVARLEIKVDEKGGLFNVDMVIPARARESLIVQPMMEGYDGGTHTTYVALLDENGDILYESDGHEIGPLEPIPGTGSWEKVQH